MSEFPLDFIICGGATGADAMALQYAIEKNIEHHVFMANWVKHGRSAGPIRNQQMITEGKPDIVIAFPGGKGTADMVRRAKLCGVKVYEATP